MTKEQSHVKMEPSNVMRKKKGNTKCDKRTVTCDVTTAQYKTGIFKCEEKKKKKGTIECDKRTITCDVETIQYENETIKCEKK